MIEEAWYSLSGAKIVVALPSVLGCAIIFIEPHRIRTCDPRLKRALLYLLS